VNELLNYVIRFFSSHMNEKGKRTYKHLLAGMPLHETEQRLLDGLAWEESRGMVLPDWAKSFQIRRRADLSDDPEVLRLASGGLEGFLDQTAGRILSEDRDHIFLNNCPSCGALARTPQARQCRRCGLDWHHNPPSPPSAQVGS